MRKVSERVETRLHAGAPPAGSNIGIGYAVAKVLTERGATVVVASRDQKKVADAVRALGPNARGEIVDLASFASIDAFVARIRSAYPRIDVLVNNAGVFLPPHSKTPEGFETTLGINTIGTAHLTNGLVPLVAQSPTGRIVNLSSDAGACTEWSMAVVSRAAIASPFVQ